MARRKKRTKRLKQLERSADSVERVGQDMSELAADSCQGLILELSLPAENVHRDVATGKAMSNVVSASISL